MSLMITIMFCPLQPGGTIYRTNCSGGIIQRDISHAIYCVADARKDRVCTVESCLCAEFELRDFVPTNCGAVVTWRVYNYCPNGVSWVRFGIEGLGGVPAGTTTGRL